MLYNQDHWFYTLEKGILMYTRNVSAVQLITRFVRATLDYNDTYEKFYIANSLRALHDIISNSRQHLNNDHGAWV